MSKLTTVIIAFLLLIGCADKTALSTDIYITNDTKSRLMPLYNGIEAQVVQQKITVNYDNSEHSFIVVLSVSASELTIAMLADFGRLLTATYNGKTISYEKSSFVPDSFPLEYMFNDIQLIIYPLEILEKYLPQNIHVEDSMEGSAKMRSLYNNNKLFALIKYYDNIGEFNNIVRNYSYVIEEI